MTGAARWVLEIKNPSEEITHDAIEQAISYARHPEVSAVYASILNGNRFLLFHDHQSSADPPIVDLEITSPEDLANQLTGVLSPAAIRRDCSPPKVDLGLPLAEGLRSTANVSSGLVRYSEFTWECNAPLPPDGRAQLDETVKRMCALRITITGGRVWRDENSRIRAKLDWAFPTDELLKFAQDKRLLDTEYVSLSSTISADANKPTVFDVVGSFHVVRGEPLYDILRWDTKVAGVDTKMNYRGQALGHIDRNIFRGSVQVEYEASFPTLPGVRLSMFGVGTFELAIDDR